MTRLLCLRAKDALRSLANLLELVCAQMRCPVNDLDLDQGRHLRSRNQDRKRPLAQTAHQVSAYRELRIRARLRCGRLQFHLALHPVAKCYVLAGHQFDQPRAMVRPEQRGRDVSSMSRLLRGRALRAVIALVLASPMPGNEAAGHLEVERRGGLRGLRQKGPQCDLSFGAAGCRVQAWHASCVAIGRTFH